MSAQYALMLYCGSNKCFNCMTVHVRMTIVDHDCSTHTYNYVIPTSIVTPNISCICIGSLTLASKQKQLIHCGCGEHTSNMLVVLGLLLQQKRQLHFKISFQTHPIRQFSNQCTAQHILTYCMLVSMMQALYQVLHISASLGTCI